MTDEPQITTEQKLRRLKGNRDYWLGRVQQFGDVERPSLLAVEAIIEDVKFAARARGEILD